MPTTRWAPLYGDPRRSAIAILNARVVLGGDPISTPIGRLDAGGELVIYDGHDLPWLTLAPDGGTLGASS